MALIPDWNLNNPVTYARMRQTLLEQTVQEGVVGATDLQVAQRGAGANMSVDVPTGAAWVRIDTGTRNGLGHVYNDATANVVVAASNATNPRIDQVILRWNDSSIPTGSGNDPTLAVLTGTATTGATLDNRTGAAALPNDCLRLADILVPATSTSVVTANIRDRRPWARGAYTRVLRTTGDLTRTLSSFADLDATALAPRIECSGVPVTVSLRGRMSQGALPSALQFQLLVDGAVTSRVAVKRGILSGGADDFDVFWNLSLSAGSHAIRPQYSVEAGSTTGTVFSNATHPLEFEISEMVRQVADNGT